jgi:hypothetical protein
VTELSRTPPRLLALVGLLVLGSVPLRVAAGAEDSEPVIEYSRDPAVVVIGYRLELGEVAERDPGPSLTIYGDGRAVVHYPRYMNRAGDYQVRLGEREMQALVRSLVDDGVMEFDEAAARQREREERSRRATLGATTDPSLTHIRLRLERYRPAGASDGEPKQADKRIRWPALADDAAEYPAIEAIRNLAAAERELAAIMERDDLRSIE